MVRVRFAPSPTGPLHIGGVRTALYNYLFAKKHNGTFILRVEDTDQTRYVEGAEEYIVDALKWTGLIPDEGPGFGGNYGPYRQSERKDIYLKYANELLNLGHAYYAFDTPEELDAEREKHGDSFKYNFETREKLKNSLSLSKEETQSYLDKKENIVIRLNVPVGKSIVIHDLIRGEVTFASDELDDKVILKGDGMPTYHLANIVDDHLMEITHVIRGEEWLPSTAHHALMYEFLGWEAPKFSHLPLIMKPSGQGKLSKRDGAKFGFPVFPLNWNDGSEIFPGFRETGFMPEALLNFLAFLGWNPGNDQEILSIEELIQLFSIEKIVKSSARFDYDKAKWYNQQYIMNTPTDTLAEMLMPQAESLGYNTTKEKLSYAAKMLKERVYFTIDLLTTGQYLFEKPKVFDQDTFNKKYKAESKPHFVAIAALLTETNLSDREQLENMIKEFIGVNQLKMGEILPVLRLCLTGTMNGPDLFDTIAILGSNESSTRILNTLP